MKKVNCYTCRDKGLKGGCPKCGKEEQVKLFTGVSKQGIYNPKTMTNVDLSKMDKSFLDRFIQVETLKKIWDLAFEGKVPDKSLILCTELGAYGKTICYKFLQMWYENKISVLPILNGNQVCKFIRGERNIDKIFGITYEDFLNSQVMIIYLDQNTNGFDFGYGVYQAISERADMGNSTIVISDKSWVQLKSMSSYSGLASLQLSKEEYEENKKMEMELGYGMIDRKRFPIIVDGGR